MTDARGWTCFGEGASHTADVAEVEELYDRGGTRKAVHRCRTCGQLYLFMSYEINDWSGGNDYSSETSIWHVLAADEVAAARADINYVTRSEAHHRIEQPWRRDN